MLEGNIRPLWGLADLRLRQRPLLEQRLDALPAAAGAGEVRNKGKQGQHRLVDSECQDQKRQIIEGLQLPAGQQKRPRQHHEADTATEDKPTQHTHRSRRPCLHVDGCAALPLKGTLQALELGARHMEGPQGLDAADIFQDSGRHFPLGILQIRADSSHPAQAQERERERQRDDQKDGQRHPPVKRRQQHSGQNEADQDDRHLGEHLLGQVSHRLIVPQQDSGQVPRIAGGIKAHGELPQVFAQGDLGVLDDAGIAGAGVDVGFQPDKEVGDQLGQETSHQKPEGGCRKSRPRLGQGGQQIVDRPQHQAVGNGHHNTVKQTPEHEPQIFIRLAQGHHLKPFFDFHARTTPFPILQRSRR